MPTVIAVSGPSGSGKSSLVHALVNLLPRARSLHLDDYKETTTFPADWPQWIQDGCPPDGFVTPKMAEDLRTLRNGPAAVHDWIVVEEPFGRGRAALSGLIDYVVCIDIPLEVALARTIRRAALHVPAAADASTIATGMIEFADQYIAVSRHIYAIVNRNVIQDCDLIVDGMKSTDALANEVASALKACCRM